MARQGIEALDPPTEITDGRDVRPSLVKADEASQQFVEARRPPIEINRKLDADDRTFRNAE